MKEDTVAANIKKFRKRQQLTQKELAEILAISPSSIVSYEKGTTFPTSDVLELMMELFHVTPNELFATGRPFSETLIDAETEIARLEEYRNATLHHVKELEAANLYIESSMPVFSEDGTVVREKRRVEAPSEQAKTYLIKVMELQKHDVKTLLSLFNVLVDSKIDHLKKSDT